MTTAPVRLTPAPNSRGTVRTSPRPRPGIAVGGRDERVTRWAGGVARAASPELTAAAGTVEQGRARTAGAIAPLTDHDAIPLLRHVDQLGPDLNQLLASVSQLSHMANRLPTVFRRRHHPKPSPNPY